MPEVWHGRGDDARRRVGLERQRELGQLVGHPLGDVRAELRHDAENNGQVAHSVDVAAQRVVQYGGAHAAVRQDALERDARRHVRVEVGGELGADGDK
eukprot:scaffold97543_cov36-Phaeocystis_antarctica.AAC.1